MIRMKPLLAVGMALSWILFAGGASTQEEPQLTVEQQAEFLLKARVTKNKTTSKGITLPQRLTMSDGQLTHDASFQSINERKMRFQGADGTVEMNFVDSYLYNLAAYELAKLLGISDMMPVTVPRSWGGRSGCFAWWLPVQMDEAERLKKKLEPPDVEAWNRQMVVMRVFSELVYDTDRNLGNVLIGKDWKLYMIDFTRAFRLYKDIKEPKNLTRCSRAVLEKLRTLDAAELKERTKGLLNKPEVEGVMARRDKIVAHFEKLVSQKGEAAVLF